MHSLFIIGCLALAGCTLNTERFVEREAEKIAEDVADEMDEESKKGESI